MAQQLCPYYCGPCFPQLGGCHQAVCCSCHDLEPLNRCVFSTLDLNVISWFLVLKSQSIEAMGVNAVVLLPSKSGSWKQAAKMAMDIKHETVDKLLSM